MDAFRDYQRNQFGGWPWDTEDPVFGKNRGRFAKHADGREEIMDEQHSTCESN